MTRTFLVVSRVVAIVAHPGPPRSDPRSVRAEDS